MFTWLTNWRLKRTLAPFRQEAKDILKEWGELQSLARKFYTGGRFFSSFLPHGAESILDSIYGDLSYLAEIAQKPTEESIREASEGLIKRVLRDKDVDGADYYFRLFEKMSERYENRASEIVGTPFQDATLERLLDNGSLFTEKAKRVSYDKIGDSMKDDFREYVSGLQAFFNVDMEEMVKRYEDFAQRFLEQCAKTLELCYAPRDRRIPSIDRFTIAPIKNSEDGMRGERKLEKSKSELKKRLLASSDWSKEVEDIARYFRETGMLLDAELLTIILDQEAGIVLAPKPRRKETSMGELVGYDRERSSVIGNTKKLIDGTGHNNVYIHGPPGTGKSALMNALLTEYAEEGLRVIEIDKGLLGYLPAVFSQIESKPEYKFLVLVDEFNKVKDKEVYSAFKKVIEGSFDGMPQNAALYVISNDKNSMKLGFKDGDAEQRSLEDRFGLVVGFPLPNEAARDEILGFYLNGSPKQDDITALTTYCKERNIRLPSPRNIRDFVRNYEPAMVEDTPTQSAIKQGHDLFPPTPKEAVSAPLA